jgi:uncharacterized protein (DUF58 family)
MTREQNLRVIKLKAKREVYTLLSGNNLSRRNGEGYDFSELREYRIGDDIRKINWTITAKMGRPYIKEFHANKELSIAVVALLTPSLHFGFKGSDEERAKLDTITEISTLLGYASIYNSDLFTGIYCLDDQTHLTPPTKELYAIDKFINSIYTSELLDSSLVYNSITREIFALLHRASLLFVLGDFLQEIDLGLLAQRHEVVVIIVRHKDERSPQRLGEVILQEPSSQSQLNTFFGNRSISRYSTNIQKSDKSLQEHLSYYGIRYITIYTDEDILSRLLELF